MTGASIRCRSHKPRRSAIGSVSSRSRNAVMAPESDGCAGVANFKPRTPPSRSRVYAVNWTTRARMRSARSCGRHRSFRCERRCTLAGTPSEHQRFGDGVAGETVGAVRGADRFARRKEVRHTRTHVAIYPDAAHVVVRDGCNLDQR